MASVINFYSHGGLFSIPMVLAIGAAMMEVAINARMNAANFMTNVLMDPFSGRRLFEL